MKEIITDGKVFDMLENYFNAGNHNKVIRIVAEEYHISYPGTYGTAPHHIPIDEYRRIILDGGMPAWEKTRSERDTCA